MKATLKFSLALLCGCALLILATGCGEAPMEGAAAAPAPATAQADMIGKNKALCAKMISAVNGHDLAAIDALLDAKFKDNNPMPGLKGDKDGMEKMFTAFFAAFPDSNCSVDMIVGEGDTVVMKMTTTGTNKGPWMGMEATNKTISVDEIHIVKVKNGKFVEHWGLEDDMAMMTQLGMMKPDVK